MTVILVRHGQSRGNSRGIIQGWLDEPLTEAGEAQARLVAARLREMRVDALYASPLARARATAEAVSTALGLPVVETPGLREHYFGAAQGLTWADASARWGLRAGHGEDWAAGVPDAEPMLAFRQRVAAAFDDLLARHQEDVAVCVTHGGTIAQVVGHVLGLPGFTTPPIRVDNTSLTVIEGPVSRPAIRTLNDACHAGGGDAAASRAF
ncbi:MAG: phosphoglycerate mutase [Chloroflexota bacterium]